MTDGASTAIGVLTVTAGVGLLAWLFVRLLRWARAGRSGAQAMGEVLTEVTQSVVVREAKQGKKRNDRRAGDPPSEE
jgi:hypothetical protein